MMANSSQSYDMSKFMKVFQSILFEQVADVEAMSNHSQSPKTPREKFNEAYEQLYPPFFPLDGILSNNKNGPWNPQRLFPNHLGSGIFQTMGNETTVSEAPPYLTTNSIEQHEDPCHLITKGEMITYENVAFFLELVVQPIFICIGFVFNTIAINVLRR